MANTLIVDFLIIACLVAVITGLWWVWPPLALIVVGGGGLVLFCLVRLLTTGGKGDGDAE